MEKEFKKENQIKTIQYIDLEKYHSKNKPSQESIKDLYEKIKIYLLQNLNHLDTQKLNQN